MCSLKEQRKELEYKINEMKNELYIIRAKETEDMLSSHKNFIGKFYKATMNDETRYYKIIKLDKSNAFRAYCLVFCISKSNNFSQDIVSIEDLGLWCSYSNLNVKSFEYISLKELTEITENEYDLALNELLKQLKEIKI